MGALFLLTKKRMDSLKNTKTELFTQIPKSLLSALKKDVKTKIRELGPRDKPRKELAYNEKPLTSVEIAELYKAKNRLELLNSLIHFNASNREFIKYVTG